MISDTMKRGITTLIALMCGLVSVNAQVADAFQGFFPVTDPSMKRSLNGDWSLKVVEGISKDISVPALDATWGKIPVPGCWEAYGFCKPKYDSPNSLTGYYRTMFTVPKAWKGQRIILCFDGVLYGYDLWINGKPVGFWRSGYNTAMFDITDYLKTSNTQQELAMRVISQFPGGDFDYNDDWAPNGIFRDVTLMAVPRVHLSDLTIRTKNSGEVSVDTKIANGDKQTMVTHEILDAQHRVVGSTKVENPHLWTAETPYLYTLRTRLIQKGKTLQTFENKFGFRELTIDGNILKLNGQAIKLRGVTSHATDPKTVKVISDELTLKDMKLMKEASVNYIRTSHYPREPRFYELADSLGFYIIDEVAFGYGDRNLSKDEFYPVLQQRAQATIRHDKNHPSVLIWSLGNENPLTDICIRLGYYVKEELDPTRPICYPQEGSYFRSLDYKIPEVADIYAPHYPTTAQLSNFYQRAERPIIFTEYLHTLGISFEDHDRQWDIIEHSAGIAGGSVWEWVDQGMPFGSEGFLTRQTDASDASQPNANAQRALPSLDEQKAMNEEYKYGYEEKVYTSANDGFEMNGNKGTDGLLYADRTPLPNYYELQRNYAQASITDSIITLGKGDTAIGLHVRNRFDFLNLKDNITFRWTISEDRDTIARGAFSPDCPPHSTVHYPLTIANYSLSTEKICLLNVEISDAQGRVFNRQSIPINPKELTERILGGLTEKTADVMSRIQGQPMVRAGRKATMTEMLRVKDKRLKKYLLPLSPDGTSAGSIKTSIKTESVSNATRFTYSLTPDSTDTFLSELGIAFLLDQQIDRVQWIGQGLMPTYPGRFRAGRYGFWALQQGDLYFEGNRQGIDAAWLTDKDGNGLLLVCKNSNVSFEQTDRGIVLTINAAVSGIGPKFANTAFPVIAKDVGTLSGSFYLYRTDAGMLPELLHTLFVMPQSIKEPFHPYVTQYDTYLMKFDDIIDR